MKMIDSKLHLAGLLNERRDFQRQGCCINIDFGALVWTHDL